LRYASLTSELDGGEWSAACPDHFTSGGKEPPVPIAYKARSDAVAKRKKSLPSPHRESKPDSPAHSLVSIDVLTYNKYTKQCDPNIMAKRKPIMSTKC
jgi:hypothetical protein